MPQLIAPVTVIVYKQFFDSVPKDFREAAVIDGANEFQLLFRVFLPMNWGITTALAHHHVHRRLEQLSLAFPGRARRDNDDDHRRHHAGAGYVWRRLCAPISPVAMLAGLPVALAYLLFQRRVTQAIMLSAGIKG